MTDPEVRKKVDAILACTGLPTSPEDYDHLLRMYPYVAQQAADVRRPAARDYEPAHIFPAGYDSGSLRNRG
jgi:hypothetical protein